MIATRTARGAEGAPPTAVLAMLGASRGDFGPGAWARSRDRCAIGTAAVPPAGILLMGVVMVEGWMRLEGGGRPSM
jgi:hypothetical protein